MASTSLPLRVAVPVGTETLAQAMRRGPVPLHAAISHAIRIATQLRELHASGRSHRAVIAEHIALDESGAELAGPCSDEDLGRAVDDVRGFGTVLYQMLNGGEVPRKSEGDALVSIAPRTGPSSLRPAAERLALRCVAVRAWDPHTIQQVLSELRVLAILCKHYGFRPIPAPPLPPEPPPAPFLMPPHSRPAGQTSSGADRRAQMLARLVDSAFPIVPSGLESGAVAKSDVMLPAMPLEPAPKRVGACPRCGESTVFVSRARSRFERVLESYRMPICRCRRCYHRWIVFFGMRIGKKMPVPSSSF